MRPEIVRADRRFAVRRAAAAWQQAGVLTATARREIDDLYADDRVRTGGWFRRLFFVFTLAGVLAGFGFVSPAFALFEWRALPGSMILLLLAAGLAALTEALLSHFRLRRFGVEEATGWVAVALAGAAVALGTSEVVELGGPLPTVVVALAVALCAALAGWRWGLPLAGAVAPAALFVALAPLPAGRWLWIATALPLAWALERAAESSSVAPSHRSRAREGWWLSLAALYWAVHVESVASGWWTFGGSAAAGGGPGGAALLLSWSVMVLLPVLLIGGGLVSRRRARLDAGLMLALATAATAVARLAPRPLWAVLLAGGLLLVGAALSLRRLFHRAPERTLAGWTSEALFEDAERAAALELAGAATALSPEARELPDEPELRGGGGEFGGGGASSGF